MTIGPLAICSYFCNSKVLCLRFHFDNFSRSSTHLKEDPVIHQNSQALGENPAVPEERRIAARSRIDYDEILADLEPGAPGGVIVFSTRGCATAEEADVALEEFIRGIMEAPDEDD
jgi:hypothetical protein